MNLHRGQPLRSSSSLRNQILRVEELEPRALLSAGASGGGFIDLGGGLVAFLTNEAAQNQDLNGDGDKLDQVLQAFNAVGGSSFNSGQQAVAGSFVDLGNGRLAFLTDEAAQGRVLNRDGDKLDQVLQVFDAVTGIVHNSFQQAIAGSLLDTGNGRVAFLTSEAAQKRDLNQDHDKLDQVLQAFDSVADVVRNSRQQAVVGTVLDAGGGFVVFLTSEAAQHRVLNRDGDKLDQVLQSFDTASGVVQNSGNQAQDGSVLDLGTGLLAFLTSEAAQGRDLNGDGDKLDTVLQIFDAVTGNVQNTGQAVS